MSDGAAAEGPSLRGRPWHELRGLALLFLRLGVTAFGGPAAHIAMIEDEAVRRRAWLTRDEFLDGVNVASLALMAVVTWQLGRAAVLDVTTGLLAVLSAVLLVRFRVNSAWLVLGGAAIGLCVQSLLPVAG